MYWFVLFLTVLFPFPVHAVVTPCNYLSETCGAERCVWLEERSVVETASLGVVCRMRAGVMMDMRRHHHRFLHRGRRCSRVRGPLRPQGLWYRPLHRRRRSGMIRTLRMNTEVHTLSRPSGCQEVCRHFVISARRRGDSSSVCWVVLVRACSSSLVRSIIGAAAVGLTFGRYLSPTLRSVVAVEEPSVGLAFGRYLSPTLRSVVAVEELSVKYAFVQGNRTTPSFASPNTPPNTRQSGIQRMMCLKPSGLSTESLLTRSCDPIASADMKLWTVKVLPSAGNKPEDQVCSCVERILSTSLEAC